MQIKQKLSDLSIKNLYFLVMLVFIIAYFVLALVTNGKSMLFSIDSAPEKVFSDFFESVYDSMKTYEESKVIYPPFINLCYRILGTAITPFAPDARAAVSTFVGAMSYAVFTIVAIFGMSCFVNTSYKGKRRNLLLLILILSMPFLYFVERGNVIIFAVLLLIPFIMWYDSEDKRKRYAAYICLALSVNIKLYPIVFALLILRNKQYREFIYFLIITAVIFFVSLLLLQDSLTAFINNLFLTTEKTIGIGITNVIFNLLYPFGLTQYASTVSIVIMVIVLILTTYIVIKSDVIENWKLIMLLSLVLCTCGTFNALYCILYTFIPLIMFLNTEPKKNVDNWIWLILFLIMTIPLIGIQLGSGETGALSSLINGVIPTIAIIYLIATELILIKKTKTETTSSTTKTD